MGAVDLRSDTVTRPTAAMREAIAKAEVGDDVYGEDPSVNRLQELAAERLGMQASLLVPSGTMANQVAIRVHTSPGDALLAGESAHADLYEGGATPALSGVQIVEVGRGGLFDSDDVAAAIAPRDVHYAQTRLVWVENTHNRSGGRVFPLERIRAIAETARARGLALHLDGARLFNAEVATGIPAAEWAAEFDSVSFCLSKGLGAPVGSLLAGSFGFVERARRFRKMFGGGMRQAGILAAAGIYALEHNVERLAEDHANARRLALGLADLPGVELVGEPETNIVLFRVPEGAGFLRRARERDLWLGAIDARTLRAVTHVDVSASDVDAALGRIEEVLE